MGVSMRNKKGEFQPGGNLIKIAEEAKSELLRLVHLNHFTLEQIVADFTEIFGETEGGFLSDVLNSSAMPSYSLIIDIMAFVVSRGHTSRYRSDQHPRIVELLEYAVANKKNVLSLSDKIGYRRKSLKDTIAFKLTPSTENLRKLERFFKNPDSSEQVRAQITQQDSSPNTVGISAAVLIKLLEGVNELLGHFLAVSTAEERQQFRRVLGQKTTFEVSNRINAACSETAFRNYSNSSK